MLSGIREGTSVILSVDVSYTQELRSAAGGVEQVQIVSSAGRSVNVVFAPSRGGVVSSFQGVFVHDGELYGCFAGFEQDGALKSAFYYPAGQKLGAGVTRTADGRYELTEGIESKLLNMSIQKDSTPIQKGNK